MSPLLCFLAGTDSSSCSVYNCRHYRNMFPAPLQFQCISDLAAFDLPCPPSTIPLLPTGYPPSTVNYVLSPTIVLILYFFLILPCSRFPTLFFFFHSRPSPNSGGNARHSSTVSVIFLLFSPYPLHSPNCDSPHLKYPYFEFRKIMRERMH